MLALTTRLAVSAKRTLAVAGILALAACADRAPTAALGTSGEANASRSDENHRDDGRQAGAVFVSTNGLAGNAVVAFRRSPSGTLAPLGTFATGGSGIGGVADPLASQFALTLSPDRELLFVVNAGSNDVSVFRVSEAGLTLVGRTPSGGTRPISVAAGKRTLYVLNTASNSIGVFRYNEQGRLHPRGVAPLSSIAAGAAAIRLSPNGDFLNVTERLSNTIDSYVVGGDGRLGTAVSTASAGRVPFGFDYTPGGLLVVSEAGSGAVSSYAQTASGSLTPRSTSVSTAGQAAPCWLIVDHAGRFAYSANAGGSSISGFAISAAGMLSLITPNGRTGDLGVGAQPLDLDISSDDGFLYVLKNATGTIGGFQVARDGTLTGMADTPGLVARAGYMGIAAY